MRSPGPPTACQSFHLPRPRSSSPLTSTCPAGRLDLKEPWGAPRSLCPPGSLGRRDLDNLRSSANETEAPDVSVPPCLPAPPLHPLRSPSLPSFLIPLQVSIGAVSFVKESIDGNYLPTRLSLSLSHCLSRSLFGRWIRVWMWKLMWPWWRRDSPFCCRIQVNLPPTESYPGLEQSEGTCIVATSGGFQQIWHVFYSEKLKGSKRLQVAQHCHCMLHRNLSNPSLCSSPTLHYHSIKLFTSDRHQHVGIYKKIWDILYCSTVPPSSQVEDDSSRTTRTSP